MKKKAKALLVLISAFFGMTILASCNGQNVVSKTGSNVSSNPISSSVSLIPEKSSDVSSNPISSSISVIPEISSSNVSSGENDPSGSAAILPEYIGFKVFLKDEEFSNTNNTLEYNYGDDYLKDISVKLIKNDNTLVDYNDFSIVSNIVSNTLPGNYTASIPYNGENIVINVIIHKIDVEIEKFDVESKTYDEQPSNVDYELSDDSLEAKLYYKLKDSNEEYSNTAPVNPGTYLCKLVVEENNIYNSKEEIKEFTISEEPKELKLYIGNQLLSDTNNKIEFTYGDTYNINNKIVVKELNKRTNIETEITDYQIETELKNDSNVGTYNVTVKYGNNDSLSFNALINKKDVNVTSFEVKSKIYDANEVLANCTFDVNNVDYKIYYKEKDTDSEYSDVAPKNVGIYEAKLLVGDNYNSNAITCEFYILGRGIGPVSGNLTETVFSTLSTGSEQTLNLEEFDSRFMFLYEKIGEEYKQVDKITGVSGTKEFKIVLNSDDVHYDPNKFSNPFMTMIVDRDTKEIEYEWNIIDSSIVQSVEYENKELSLKEFMELGKYSSNIVTFNCIDGYYVNICDYDGFNQQLTGSGEVYLTITDENGFEPLFRQLLVINNGDLDGLKINDELYDIENDIYYYVSNSDNEIVIEFINPSSNFSYYISEGRSGNFEVNGKLVLPKDEYRIELRRKIGYGVTIFSTIHIVLYNPIKSITAVRYSMIDNILCGEEIKENYMGMYDTMANNDFLVDFVVELNEGYEDCEIRLTDREYGGYPNFVKYMQRPNNTGYSSNYVILDVIKDGVIIKSLTIGIENSPIQLDGAIEDSFANRGRYESVILSSDGNVEFKPAGTNPSGTILVNGSDTKTKTYDNPGVYKELITYKQEVLGVEYSVDFNCIVLVSLDTQDFGNFRCSYGNNNSYGSYIYDDESNCFGGIFDYSSIINFDVSTFEISNANYNISNVTLINDEELEVTYFEVTLNDGASDYVLYLLIPTDKSVNLSLDITDNVLMLENIIGTEEIEFDEYNHAHINNASKNDLISISFESKVTIEITNPKDKVENKGSMSSLDNYELSQSGLYIIKITNSKGLSEYYYIEVDEFKDALSISVGDVDLIYSQNKSDFDTNDGIIMEGFLGKDKIDLIENNKIKVNISGLLALYAYDEDKNKIDDEAYLNVIEDLIGVKYAQLFIYLPDYMYNFIIYFDDKPIGPVSLVVGNNIFDLGDGDTSFGDIIQSPFGGNTLLLNDFSNELYLKGKEVYDDYSYSLIIFDYSVFGSFNFQDDMPLSTLEENGYLYRITDQESLTKKINKKLGCMSYGYILPYGTPLNATLNDYVTGLNDMFKICKNNYIFEIEIGNKTLYASVSFDDYMSVVMNDPELDDNAYSCEYNGKKYSELVFILPYEEKENIENGVYAVKIKSGYYLNNFYYDSNCSSSLDPLDSEHSFIVSTDSQNQKYISIYYNFYDNVVGNGTITLKFAKLQKILS